MPAIAPFNPNAAFVVRKPMTINGTNLTPGDRFPKEAVAGRRIRQLVSNRWVVQVAPASPPSPVAAKEKKRG